MSRFNASPSSSRVALLAMLTLFGAACGDDGSTTEPEPTAPQGILVLDGFIQPGLTMLADTGSASTKVTFGPSTEFDAGGFSLERDTVLAVSSRGAGDLLYLLPVDTRTVTRVQMPARSNPGRARLLRGSGGRSLIGVALRDSSTVALVTVSAGTQPAIARLSNVGLCPTDVFQHGDDTWVVDANANCRTNYAVQGEVRLIRIPASGAARDTLVISGARGSSPSAIVVGDVAYVTAPGEANFATTPYTLLSSGTVTRVDLRNRRVLAQRTMPASAYGAGVKRGLDGFLYVSLYQDLVAFRSRILKMRADDLSFVSAAGATAPWMSLQAADGSEASCSSGQADALGRLHCIVNGTGSATSLLVFDVAGREIRRVPAGQGGVDLALR